MDLTAADVVQEQAACIQQAAQAYGVDQNHVVHELQLRTGARRQIVRAQDGNYEVGAMRIPSIAMPALAQYGITAEQLVENECLNIQVGTYMLRLRELDQARASVVTMAARRGKTTPRSDCVRAASARYQVPEQVIWAYLRTEGGTVGQYRTNKNGTIDMGPMQVNSVHLTGAPFRFERYGITRERLINDECLNIHVGTYVAAYQIARAPDFWTGVGNYHSATPAKRERYMSRFLTHMRAVAKDVGR
ncbi:lytic transglycosylase domain-containing protein [Pseudoxanthomonas kaohsiungensis]|uniref:Lytic transglycosylase n=1 Tax=Pseudoxanthomonas kaohsiungensis TaxID=283923 RepID=A0ABW3LYR5_9GAMM|nr:lytic transglycosylase domain-containing protein [Pseudoxanthomonas kaohsiungensis]KAF1702931.1 hypothetical protein CSC66_09150 [Pseudoxanthomonas kaohsiungensis]